jgi:integrase
VAAPIAPSFHPAYKAALSVAYGAGLRVSEVATLKVSDIDSERMMLRVEQGHHRTPSGGGTQLGPAARCLESALVTADAEKWWPVIKEFDMLLLGFFFPFMSLTSLARAISVPGRGTLIPD